ncbi:2'-5' RNA ligase family protein [Microbacterium trichothecenolyticum]|uniref:2'-5' RNA ligase n=1 Tax=Microbacterium trichothecenolyticum TaxID=69370 RepID=A0ABU0TUG9_MICTR|nr:2'-5' RNA ligase family protein [Microbacterium trichothecenolyticum]MDQ1123284.1 2'-5' RNA ligase [Microbacterium trichothecenolyticum]
MSHVVSLELLLDAAADAAVRSEWNLLAAAGLPSQAHHTGETNSPHITLLVRSTLPEIDATAVRPMLPLALTLGAPVLFGSGRTRVVARSVVPSSALLELHTSVHTLAGPGDDVAHTRPGAWSPHVTLARRVPLDRIGAALDALSGGGGDLPARATAIRRWDAALKTVTFVA